MKKYFIWGGEQALKKWSTTKSSAKSERARKARREERKRIMREKQKECAARRKEKERLSEEARDGSEESEGASFDERSNSKPKKNGRNEAVLVDSTILKILGRTPKSQVTSKGRGKREAPPVVAPKKKSVPILRKITHEKMQERKKKSKLPATATLATKLPGQQHSQLTESTAKMDKTVEEKQLKADVCEVVPCVSLGPDCGIGTETQLRGIEEEVKSLKLNLYKSLPLLIVDTCLQGCLK